MCARVCGGVARWFKAQRSLTVATDVSSIQGEWIQFFLSVIVYKNSDGSSDGWPKTFTKYQRHKTCLNG